MEWKRYSTESFWFLIYYKKYFITCYSIKQNIQKIQQSLKYLSHNFDPRSNNKPIGKIYRSHSFHWKERSVCIEQEIKALLFVNNMSRQEQFELSTFLAKTSEKDKTLIIKKNGGTREKDGWNKVWVKMLLLCSCC